MQKKPTAVKIAEGNRAKVAKAKIDPSAEAQPLAEIPSCPAHLSERAQEEWKFLSEYLFKCGLLTIVDKSQLAIICDAWGKWVEAEEQYKEAGSKVVVDTLYGGTKLNPLWSACQSAAQGLAKLLPAMGMTPQSRAGLKVDKPHDEGDLWAEFVRRTQVKKKAGK